MSLSNENLIFEIRRRACQFFIDQANLDTGLISDRASNFSEDNYSVSSIASSGYGLVALVVSVEHKYISNNDAYCQALKTLKFVKDHLVNKFGWYYHFVDKQSGDRVWNCEISSIDTAILVTGALVCGQYFEKTEVQELANIIYEKIDWKWMLTNDGQYPDKLVLSHGWKPEIGFLKSNWDTYCEHMFLYLLGMASKNKALSGLSWDAWRRPLISWGGKKTLYGGPIFIHQMSHGFYNFKDKNDRLGWNYWNTSVEATHINREFCYANSHNRKSYSQNIWGLNSCDHPDGYKTSAAPGDEDGTVSPSGAIASIIFTPELSIEAANIFYKNFRDKLWGKYGFSNALNVDRNWYGKDVIGIDLGMLLISIENWETGMIWELMASHYSTSIAFEKAGFKYS